MAIERFRWGRAGGLLASGHGPCCSPGPTGAGLSADDLRRKLRQRGPPPSLGASSLRCTSASASRRDGPPPGWAHPASLALRGAMHPASTREPAAPGCAVEWTASIARCRARCGASSHRDPGPSPGSRRPPSPALHATPRPTARARPPPPHHGSAHTSLVACRGGPTRGRDLCCNLLSKNLFALRTGSVGCVPGSTGARPRTAARRKDAPQRAALWATTS